MLTAIKKVKDHSHSLYRAFPPTEKSISTPGKAFLTSEKKISSLICSQAYCDHLERSRNFLPFRSI